jgi:osmotically-inducible protein OsmY
MQLKVVVGLLGVVACGHSPAPPPTTAAPSQIRAARSSEQTAGFRAEKMSPADRAVAERVRQRLEQHPYLSGSELQVVAQQGNVELSGRVNSDFERQVAGQVSRQVPGVKRVTNELAVTPPKPQDLDQRLSREIDASLVRVAPGSNVKARVEKGVVTLTGTLTDWDVYDAIMLAVYRAGPKSVENELEVTTRRPDEYIDLSAPSH